MKNLLHSLGRRQRADKKEGCLPSGSAGEKQNVSMVGEEIITVEGRSMYLHDSFVIKFLWPH